MVCQTKERYDTFGRKWKWIHNVNLEWFKTVRAFTLGQKWNYEQKLKFTAAIFAANISIVKML